MNATGCICTDGAFDMLGNRSGFAAHLKREVSEGQGMNFLFHLHVLAVKPSLKHLQAVLLSGVKTVNSIRGHSLKHRLFQAFCKSIVSEHTVALCHTEVRYIFCGRDLFCNVYLSFVRRSAIYRGAKRLSLFFIRFSRIYANVC